MAKLLVRTVNGENALRYMRGDIVAAFADEHQFGRMESLAVWVGEGRDPAAWPGGFAVVQIDGLTVEQARAYLEEVPLAGAAGNVMGRRRKHAIDLDALERRTLASGRDTLRTENQITRRWAEVMDTIKVKA